MMGNIEDFKRKVKGAASEFSAIDKKQTIRIISHLDCDGICAASTIINALSNDNRKYSISIVQQLNDKILEELSAEEYSVYIFTDLGSGKISSISKNLEGRKIFILDHHEIEENTVIPDNITHVNPHDFGVDGSREVSGSGVVYLFAKSLSDKNTDMAHIAVIGAIGDIQEEGGFLGLNKEILDDAVSAGKLEVKYGLNFFGSQTRPLHKLLEYSTDPYIPGVSGSESGAIQFLTSLGINPKNGSGWTKLTNLTSDEVKKLSAAIIIRRSAETDPEKIFGNVYLLPQEEDESPLKDAKEFSTLLNSCGRMNNSSIGIGTCLGKKASKKKAISHLANYKKEIVSALRWFEGNKDSSGKVTKGEGYIIINAGEEILHTIIGTLASILSKSGDIPSGTYILSLARSLMEDTTKVSLRIAGNGNNGDVDLRMIVNQAISALGEGESGGHSNAAGAMIPTECEDRFLEIARDILDKSSIMEKVL